MHRFLFELKSRGVLKVATGYLVVSWLVLEVGHTLFEIFDLPHLGLQAIFVLLVLGFPAAIGAAWYWRFAAESAAHDGAHDHSAAHDAPQLAIVFAAVALIAVAIVIGARFFGFEAGKRPAHDGAAQEHGRAAESAQNARPFAPPPHSIAVMSFVNLSGNPKDEYFSDGLSEELLDVLARITELRVAARTSSFSFKTATVDIPTVGRKLNVGAVLEGSVRKAGERVRITAQLINALTGYHIWSQTYERDLVDIFALQSEIAQAVAGALKVTLLADTKESLTEGGTKNAQAYDAYMRARYGQSIQDEAGLRAALGALDEAIGSDPGYAQAHAFRAEVAQQLAGLWVTDPKEKDHLFAEARASADKAVAMAPGLGGAYLALGAVLASTTADYSAIDAAYRRSVELEPGNAVVLHQYASYAAEFGRPDALTAARRAVSLDPLGLGAHANLGVVLFYAHRYDEARAAFLESKKLGNNRLTLNWIAMNELAAGKPAAALPYCARDSDFWYDQLCLAMAYSKLNRKKDAQVELGKLKAGQGDGAAYQLAEVYAYWGDSGEALKWLSKALELKDGGLMAVKTDPFLDSVRGSREFKEIVAQLKLPS